MSGDAIVIHSGVAAETVAGGVLPIDTRFCTALGIDINVTALTGGASPSITVFLDRLSPDGQFYPAWSPAAIAATGKTSANISPTNPTAAQNAVLGPSCQLRWQFTGATPPTSVTFSVTVYRHP